MLIDMPILSMFVWIPIFFGVLSLFLKNKRKFVENLSLFSTIFCLILCVPLIQYFRSDIWEMQYIEYYEWLPNLGIYYSLGIDGFSLPLLILTCFMTLIVVVFSRSIINKNYAYYYSSFLIMQGFISGMFVSLDSILFYVFFEAMLIPMFIIIGIWGGSNRVYATLKFFLYTFFGSVFLLIGLIYLHFVALKTTGDLTFSVLIFQSLPLSLLQQKWLFWGFFIAFAIKVPMWPVHTWLPDAHVEAPTGGSVILAAITLKVGGYGIVRFLLPIVPDACSLFSWFVIFISLLAIVYIGFVALVQKDLKKLIAYSSISHMGFVTLGIFIIFNIFSSSENISDACVGIEGSMIQMISHGFISGALFLCVGVLYERMKTRNIDNYGGVSNTMPLFAAFFMLFAMANSGLPGTSGFVGEFLVIIAAFRAKIIYAFAAGTTLILGASYTLWMYKRVMFGKIKNPLVFNLSDLNVREIIVFFLLSGLILLFGVWPDPLLNVMHSSVEHLISQVMQSKV